MTDAEVKALYKLVGTQRVRSMTRAEAFALNSARTDGKKWVNDPTITADEITEDPPSESGGPNFTATLAKSVREQAVQYQKEAHAKEQAMKTAAASGARKAVRLPGRDSDDNEYRGLSMCQIIRYAAHKGCNNQQIKSVCERAGFVPAKGTIVIQGGKGRKGEKIPNVSHELSVELLTDVLPPAGSGKVKAEVKAETPEDKAARKAAKAARKAAKREKAHKLLGK